MQETVAVPESTMLDGEIAMQVRAEGTESVRAIVPANPFTAASVIVEVAEAPMMTEPGEVATIVKSVILNVAVAE